MKKIKYFLIVSLLSIFLFYSLGCSATLNEIEKNWKHEHGFNEIYVYEGTGNISSMTWSGTGGLIFLENTISSEEQSYIELYKNDDSYTETTLSNNDSNNYSGIAFINSEKKLRIEILTEPWFSIYITYI